MFWISPSAVVLGDVTLGEDVSVWPTAVIRGDVERIVVGEGSNVQDGAIIHADLGVPTIIGRHCVIGHRAIVHGTVIEDGCLVGMGAILLNRCHIGTGSMIGAGAVVPEGSVIPAGSLVLGVPGEVVRELTPEQKEKVLANARRYVELKERHRRGEFGQRSPEPVDEVGPGPGRGKLEGSASEKQ
jgi:carbonic anhydrase/acetyltransferase-like protein (isoleucine patch superfamily)